MDKKILILGAGRSSGTLIDYLLNQSQQFEWKITVADTNLALAKAKVKNHPNGFPVDIDYISQTHLLAAFDLIISLLPPNLHFEVAQACVHFKKNFLTTSYVTDKINSLHEEAIKNKVLLMMECGLDPGLDHISAMKMLDEMKEMGGRINSFKSYCGGLVAPSSDNNNWNYKITWNPRNVVLAGQGGVVKYLMRGKKKFITYHQLFERTENIEIEYYGSFEAYFNRDSLNYQSLYGLDGIQTLVRGTLRRPGFSKAWDILVHLGLTDDSFTIEDSENMTYKEFFSSFLPHTVDFNTLDEFWEQNHGHISDLVKEKIIYLGLVENEKIGIPNATPAQILQKRMIEKLKLEENDKDMVVLYHEMIYDYNQRMRFKKSSLVVEGTNSEETAMAKLVGLPLGMVAKLILTDKLNLSGVHIPVYPEIYNPVLKELKELGIKFTEVIL
jgi:saccharopine dehydrogenase-like NADP-dependent oxidoreductase